MHTPEEIVKVVFGDLDRPTNWSITQKILYYTLGFPLNYDERAFRKKDELYRLSLKCSSQSIKKELKQLGYRDNIICKIRTATVEATRKAKKRLELSDPKLASVVKESKNHFSCYSTSHAFSCSIGQWRPRTNKERQNIELFKRFHKDRRNLLKKKLKKIDI